MFQAPDTTPLPALPRDERADDDRRDRDGDNGRDSEGGDDRDPEGGDGNEGAPRRKRSRGGRRRRKSDEADSDKLDSSDDDDSADNDGETGEGNGTRRRRRRARAGEAADVSPDDPDNTVVKVREGRTAEDEITGVAGSTRLEAKKQRRREGREAGRRRAPIVSEAEFLARRESVKREMIVRQHSAGSVGGGAHEGDYTQIVVLEDGVLVEHYVARESQTSLIGNVYLGQVQNVLPSMEAAFIDIGAGRNAVLYAGEVDWSTFGNGKARKIEDALEPGQSVLVQVSKDPIGQKGARLTSQISIPGRFLVYVPGGQVNGISRKLPENERTRLKTLLKEVLPDEAGVIVRTAAEGATEDQLTRDVTALTARWEDIVKKAETGKAPQQLYAEPDLVIKVVRDLFNEDFASLVIDGPDAWDNINGYISHVAPDLAERVTRWEKPAGENAPADAFAAYRIDEQIHKALDRKVYLPSGGSLVIDRTEAMTVVDVNTGKFTGSGGNLEETVTKNNLEAAEEIVRQLRLRDIGGIIVIDFIDMVLESNRDLVLRRLVECLGRDRTRHQVAEVTSLGLVQMTRKRIGTGLLESFSHECEHCKGRGVVVTAEPVEPKKDEPRQQQARSRRGGRGRGAKAGAEQNGDQGVEQAPVEPAAVTADGVDDPVDVTSDDSSADLPDGEATS
jgi:ribonuclease E